MNSELSRRGVAYDPRMAYEIACGLEDPAEIAARYGVTPDQWELLAKHKPFLIAVARYRKELKESGYTFRTKAHLQAEDLLGTAYLMAKDPNTPANVRAQLIVWTAKVAGLEPDARAVQGPQGGGFQVNINLGDGQHQKTITIDGQHLPAPVEGS